MVSKCCIFWCVGTSFHLPTRKYKNYTSAIIVTSPSNKTWRFGGAHLVAYSSRIQWCFTGRWKLRDGQLKIFLLGQYGSPFSSAVSQPQFSSSSSLLPALASSLWHFNWFSSQSVLKNWFHNLRKKFLTHSLLTINQIMKSINRTFVCLDSVLHGKLINLDLNKFCQLQI